MFTFSWTFKKAFSLVMLCPVKIKSSDMEPAAEKADSTLTLGLSRTAIDDLNQTTHGLIVECNVTVAPGDQDLQNKNFTIEMTVFLATSKTPITLFEWSTSRNSTEVRVHLSLEGTSAPMNIVVCIVLPLYTTIEHPIGR